MSTEMLVAEFKEYSNEMNETQYCFPAYKIKTHVFVGVGFVWFGFNVDTVL